MKFHMSFSRPFPKNLPDGPFSEAAASYVHRLRQFYDSRAAWHRRFYRWSGIYVIISGAGLPVLASFEYPGKNFAIALIGASIAAVTALRSFYRWDESWVLLRRAEIAISTAYWQWLARMEASGNGRNSHEANSDLLDALCKIRINESDSFFKGLSFPQADRSKEKQN